MSIKNIPLKLNMKKRRNDKMSIISTQLSIFRSHTSISQYKYWQVLNSHSKNTYLFSIVINFIKFSHFPDCMIWFLEQQKIDIKNHKTRFAIVFRNYSHHVFSIHFSIWNGVFFSRKFISGARKNLWQTSHKIKRKRLGNWIWNVAVVSWDSREMDLR